MGDAFIYDHVRTPRGRGKLDGAWQPEVVHATGDLAAITDDGHVLALERELRGELWRLAAPAGSPW